MKFQIELSIDDLREANRAHFKRNAAIKQLVFWLIMLVAAIFFYNLFQHRPPAQHSLSNVEGGTGNSLKLLAFVSMFILVGIGILLSKISVRKYWKDNPNLRYPFECNVDDRGLTSSSAIGGGFIEWIGFQGFLETKNLFLLYQGKSMFHIIPKRAFTIEEVSKFRMLIEDKIPKVGSRI